MKDPQESRQVVPPLDWPHRAGTADAVLRAVGTKVRRRRRRLVFRVAGVAACFALMAMLALPKFSRLENSRSATAEMIRPTRQVLADGSVVELRGNAEIQVNFTPALRRVILRRGVAHFQVAKNPARPFVVVAGTVEARAVGTGFVVSLDPSEVSVLVTEGHVAVSESSAPGGKDPRPFALLEPHQLAVIDVRSGGTGSAVPQVKSVTDAGFNDRVGWRIPRLKFMRTRLEEAVALFNRFNQGKLVLGDPRLGDIHVSGVLRADQPDVLLQLLASDFGIVAERNTAGELVLREASN